MKKDSLDLTGLFNIVGSKADLNETSDEDIDVISALWNGWSVPVTPEEVATAKRQLAAWKDSNR